MPCFLDICNTVSLSFQDSELSLLLRNSYNCPMKTEGNIFPGI